MDQYPLNSYDNEQRWAAMTPSAVTPAVVTMVLYLVLWLTGRPGCEGRLLAGSVAH